VLSPCLSICTRWGGVRSTSHLPRPTSRAIHMRPALIPRTCVSCPHDRSVRSCRPKTINSPWACGGVIIPREKSQVLRLVVVGLFHSPVWHVVANGRAAEPLVPPSLHWPSCQDRPHTRGGGEGVEPHNVCLAPLAVVPLAFHPRTPSGMGCCCCTPAYRAVRQWVC